MVKIFIGCCGYITFIFDRFLVELFNEKLMGSFGQFYFDLCLLYLLSELI